MVTLSPSTALVLLAFSYAGGKDMIVIGCTKVVLKMQENMWQCAQRMSSTQ